MRIAFVVYAILTAAFVGGCELYLVRLGASITGRVSFEPLDVFMVASIVGNLLMAGLALRNSARMLIAIAVLYIAVQTINVLSAEVSSDVVMMLIPLVVVKSAIALILGISLLREEIS